MGAVNRYALVIRYAAGNTEMIEYNTEAEAQADYNVAVTDFPKLVTVTLVQVIAHRELR